MKEIKTTNALMKYLRNKKGVDINGCKEKNDLLNIGYYHAYKGCRFYNEKSNVFNITKFFQLEAIYNFDTQTKSLIYPHIMFIETALKNRLLQNIVEYGKSEKFSDLFDSCFNGHKDFPVANPSHNKLSKKRTELKAKIYNDLSKNYDHRIIGHFYKKDVQVPIWALFEILTLGDFSRLYECLNKELRLILSEELKLNKTLDSDGNTLKVAIYALKDLRNSIAHNNFIYDNRFKRDKEVSFRLTKYFNIELKIPNVNFQSICDYIILIAYLLKLLKVSKTEIKKFIKQFKDIINNLYQNVDSLSIYNKIIPTDTFRKLNIFEKFL